MPSPFTGMDPYLEARNLWRGLHLRLINNIANDLQPRLLPRYVVMPEERVLLAPLDEPFEPDITIREPGDGSAGGVQLAARVNAEEATVPEIIEVPELTVPHRFVEIVDLSDNEVVTVIEVLSPWNKTGKGLDRYRERQELFLMSEANLVEIDLLRRGQHAVAVPASRLQPSDYRVCVHRAESQKFEVIRFAVRDALPNVAIPLRERNERIVLFLGAVLDRCYDEGAYRYVLDYSRPPDPPLSPEDAAWAGERLRSSSADA